MSGGLDREAAAQWFAYRDATPEQAERCKKVRSAMGAAARAWVDACPDGREQTVGLRKLKDACQAMIDCIVRPYPKP